MNALIKSINDEFFPTPKSLLDKIESDFCDMWEDLSERAPSESDQLAGTVWRIGRVHP